VFIAGSRFVRGRDRRPLLIGVAGRIRDPQIVLGMLIEVFGRDPVVADRRLPRKRGVTLEYLLRAAADSYVRAVTVEGVIA
jgi:hypothetical protein